MFPIGFTLKPMSNAAGSSLLRTAASATVTVSTVRCREGRTTWYETALIVGGRVSDSRRTSKKFDAGFEHDAAVAFVRGYVDPRSVRADFYAAALAEVA